MTRRRRLSEDDKAVWAKVAEATHPMHPKARKPTVKPTPPKRQVMPVAPTFRRMETAPLPKVSLDLAPDPAQALREAASQLDGKRAMKLRQGKMAPDARIDLHGMTLATAHTALNGFVQRCSEDGMRMVLVITGKGRMDHGDDTRRIGALRHSVPQWLSMSPLKPLVVQVMPAHQRHGGTGAYYVYLRRRR